MPLSKRISETGVCVFYMYPWLIAVNHRFLSEYAYVKVGGKDAFIFSVWNATRDKRHPSESMDLGIVWTLRESTCNRRRKYTWKDASSEKNIMMLKHHGRRLNKAKWFVYLLLYIYFPVRKGGCSPKLTSFWRVPIKYKRNCQMFSTQLRAVSREGAPPYIVTEWENIRPRHW